MSNKSIRVCDTCGKEMPIEKTTTAIKGWYWISKLTLGFNNPKPKKKDKSIHLIKIDETDPDFCSEECAINWFTRQLMK